MAKPRKRDNAVSELDSGINDFVDGAADEKVSNVEVVTKEETERLSVVLPKSLLAQLEEQSLMRKRAKKAGKYTGEWSMSSIVRESLQAHFKKKEKY